MRTSMSGAVSFQVKPFSTSNKYEPTSCDKTCDQDASKYLSKTSGYVLTLKDCLDSCSLLAECDSVAFAFDGFCSHFGLEARKKTHKMDRVCHERANKCAHDNGGCDSRRPCTNSNGSVKCEDCPAGYANDGATGCKDVNECAKDNGGCDGKRACTNTDGSMSCRDCPAGYVNDGAKKCKDVDECATKNGGCDSKRKCTNTDGSFKCENCPAGYVNDGGKGCKDVDECATNNGGCDSNRKCTNTPGSFRCEPCAAGYVNDGAKGCKDVNECLSNNGGCDSKRKCTNTVGSSKCEDCSTGYENDGATGCRRRNPCPTDSGQNPCEHNNGGCHFKRQCTMNTAGKAQCGDCPAGYDNDGEEECKSTAGDFNAVCEDRNGEIWIGEPKVNDMDECIKSCMDRKDCLSVSFYTLHQAGKKGCSHWKTMCRTTKFREGVLSKNLKGDALNKLECDVNQGERWIGKTQVDTKQDCSDACMNEGNCNSFTYYNHGSCSFFSTCCEKTVPTHNAHTECWRLPPL